MAKDIRVLGNIDNLLKFDDTEDWRLYEQKLEQYFLAKGIEEQRKVPVYCRYIKLFKY